MYEFAHSNSYTPREKELIEYLSKRGESSRYIGNIINRHHSGIAEYIRRNKINNNNHEYICKFNERIKQKNHITYTRF